MSDIENYKTALHKIIWPQAFTNFFIKTKNLLDSLELEDKHIILAVSWWADSMLMSMLILSYYQLNHFDTSNIHIAHCNHKIRKESEEEAEVMKIFFSWLDFHLYERDVKDNTTDENSLRIRRYSQFSSLQKLTSSSFICLGHHLNDRVESTILNLMRWANIKGFLNMRHIQEHPLLPNWCKICRPLLSISKWEILRICREWRLKYFEDYTNKDITISKRNRVRNQILNPLIYWEDDVDGNNFLESFSSIYDEVERLENIDKESAGDNLKTMPVHSNRNAVYSYKRLWNISNIEENKLIKLWDDLWIKTQKSKILVKEWKEWLNSWKNGYKLLDWTYFFIHENELYIIKADKDFWSKQTAEYGIEIKDMNNIYFDWFELNIPRDELIWSVVRLPKDWDKFNWKTRNRWSLNQKIPMRWRNRIPLSIKDWKVIHMRKNIRK